MEVDSWPSVLLPIITRYSNRDLDGGITVSDILYTYIHTYTYIYIDRVSWKANLPPGAFEWRTALVICEL